MADEGTGPRLPMAFGFDGRDTRADVSGASRAYGLTGRVSVVRV